MSSEIGELNLCSEQVVGCYPIIAVALFYWASNHIRILNVGFSEEKLVKKIKSLEIWIMLDFCFLTVAYTSFFVAKKITHVTFTGGQMKLIKSVCVVIFASEGPKGSPA